MLLRPPSSLRGFRLINLSRVNDFNGLTGLEKRRLSYTRKTESVELAYEVYKPRDDLKLQRGPLLIVHGLFGSKQNWRSLSKSLATQLSREVWAIDLRNHGTSPHVRPHTYPTMAGDVVSLIDRHRLEDVSLMGHSMGGKVSMTLALSFPNVIRDLVVVDIAPNRGSISEEFKGYLKVMKSIESGSIKSRKEADMVMRESISDPSIRAFLLTNLQPITSDSPNAKFRVPLDIIDDHIDDLGDFSYEPGVDNVRWEGKTLMIKGTKSKYINHHNIPAARAFFSNMRVEELDAGHWVHAERPIEFLDLVTKFLRGG